MDRLALSGLALATAGGLALVAVELIGTAHAGRSEDKTYLVALSRGTSLHLVASPREAATKATGAYDFRRLSCRRVIAVPAVSLGFHCRER